MDLGKVETCAHCGKQFKAFLDKHDEQDCIDGLREENARLREALEQIVVEERSLIVNGKLHPGHVSQSLHFATSALAAAKGE